MFSRPEIIKLLKKVHTSNLRTKFYAPMVFAIKFKSSINTFLRKNNYFFRLRPKKVLWLINIQCGRKTIAADAMIVFYFVIKTIKNNHNAQRPYLLCFNGCIVFNVILSIVTEAPCQLQNTCCQYIFLSLIATHSVSFNYLSIYTSKKICF